MNHNYPRPVANNVCFRFPSENNQREYIATELIGSGTSASLYRAYRDDDPQPADPGQRRHCRYAVRKQTFMIPMHLALAERAAVRLLAWRDLSTAKHSYLVPVLESVDVVESSPIRSTQLNRYTVMELSEIGDLSDYLLRLPDQRMSERDALVMGLRIGRCVESMHRDSYMHRDLKPENIVLFIAAAGGPLIPKLIDFDFVRAEANPGDRNLTQRIGTARFMAPELLASCTADFYGLPVDIWALGCTILFMLIGNENFNSSIRDCAHVRNVMGLFSSFYSNDTLRLLDALLCEDPNQRLDISQFLRHPLIQSLADDRDVNVPIQ